MDDEETRADGVRRIIQAGAVAQRLGASRVVVHPGRDVPIVNLQRELQWTAENLLRALEKMPAGIMVGLETMGRDFPGNAEAMLALLDRLPADRAGVCIDTGHLHQWTDVVKYIDAMTGRIISVHLQDNHGQKDEHLLPGSGTIDWPAVLAALHRSNYTGVLMCEGADPGKAPAANARTFVERMRELGKDR
jgi:sugar phosphate isomerase/epimerase